MVIKTHHPSYRRNEERGKAIADLVYGRRWPELAASLGRSNAEYNRACDELDELTAQGRVFTIAPSRDMHIGRMEKDVEKIGDWYWLGYEDGKASLEALRAYLAR